MQIGNELEFADWFSNPVERDQVKTNIRAAFRDTEKDHRIVLGPVKWNTLNPGDDRCPPVHPDYKGDPELLIGTARVLVVKPADSGFLGEVDPRDRNRLREITMTAYREARGNEKALSDVECDFIIEKLGPKVAMRHLKHAVDNKIIN